MTSTLYDVMGPEAQQTVRRGSLWVGAAIIAVVAFVLVQLGRNGQLDPRIWSVLFSRDLAQLLLRGAWATLIVASAAISLSLVAGVLLASMRLSRNRWLRIPAAIWMEIFRGLPLLVLIFFIFFGAPALGLSVTSFWALVLAISLYNSAVMSEIFRAGILALPKGQTEAAQAVGLSPATIFGIILLPQAVRHMLPALISQVVIILKESSLGFVIGYTELLRSGRVAIEYLGSAYAIPVYIAIALVFLLVNVSLSKAAQRIQTRANNK